MKKLQLLILLFVFSFGLISCNENGGSDDSLTPTEKYYSINVQTCDNGEIIVDKIKAKCGEKISITSNPNSGYVLNDEALYYTSINSPKKIEVEEEFLMPGYDINLYASFLKLCKVTFVVGGYVKYVEYVIEGDQPYKYASELVEDLYLLQFYDDISYKFRYYFTPIREDKIIYVKKLFNPYPVASKGKPEQAYSKKYSDNDMMNKVITNVTFNFFNPAYLKVYAQAGDTVFVATTTIYLNMDKLVMLSVAGAMGEIYNGGEASNIVRIYDYLGHNALMFTVSQTGYYYVAVTYTPYVLEQFGYNDLYYKFDATAMILN